MRRLAMLSFHTSPLAQPGTGDGGGMNVYVRELAAALSRSGATCDVFTRRDDRKLPRTQIVEPGFVVHSIDAGPPSLVAKEDLCQYVPEYTKGVLDVINQASFTTEVRFEALHANYWLSGLAGHALKHQLDLPLVSTFHTLDRVKAEQVPEEIVGDIPHRRAGAEASIIKCSDAVLASCSVEATQIETLYGADRTRINIVAPGVDHAFFAPGDRRKARAALGLVQDETVLLFVGRIQPLKGAEVALDVLARLVYGSYGKEERNRGKYRLVIVGGPSGPHGDESYRRLKETILDRNLGSNVTMVAPQPHELLSTYYRASDVCLVPSRTESFGLVALEAGACGVPVVASAVGGLTTLVDDGETGYLVSRPNGASFFHAVQKIIENPALAEKMSVNAVLRAQRYSWRGAARALREVHDALLKRELIECS